MFAGCIVAPGNLFFWPGGLLCLPLKVAAHFSGFKPHSGFKWSRMAIRLLLSLRLKTQQGLAVVHLYVPHSLNWVWYLLVYIALIISLSLPEASLNLQCY
jgi:hypothetical protein